MIPQLAPYTFDDALEPFIVCVDGLFARPERSLERRPDYARLIESVSMLVPLPRRKRA